MRIFSSTHHTEPPYAASPPRRNARLVHAIRDEFVEMPCMRLTRAQFRRLWNLTAAECEDVVVHLTDSGFLAEGRDGRLGRQVELR
jgi:hypothetical protein